MPIHRKRSSADNLCESCGVALADIEHAFRLLTDRIVAELAATGQLTGDPDIDVVTLKRVQGEHLAELARAQRAAGDLDVIALYDASPEYGRAYGDD